MVLVANKIDLPEEAKVSRQEGLAIAQKYNIPFFEASAKDNINVHEAFHELIREWVRKSKIQ